ncbi:hypothetical protein WKH27_17520 [Pantoea agglomerans]|uniref:hypothetical protein n=1 Tax=Enterobacter agglomerans TaxID=549 RepID=UPI0002E7903C|nr:hypothetical protein [Pantoea agglomerans]QGY59233.1 hypothetical protein PAASB05_15535 [Pantoea agglomerans]TCZ23658.1 hypothetical protein EYB39_19095 [Pantoea agglomerans]WNK34608.1 hypothetical protein RM158_16355 [Pantoea agglomerans]WNK52910.1 hypothetical protein RM154_16370 [Pantoea agglomerans]WNK70865.1 hypothetical protein RM155_16260 [Pantoea agglomerans]
MMLILAIFFACRGLRNKRSALKVARPDRKIIAGDQGIPAVAVMKKQGEQEGRRRAGYEL